MGREEGLMSGSMLGGSSIEPKKGGKQSKHYTLSGGALKQDQIRGGANFVN
jgi:hypothetical protein